MARKTFSVDTFRTNINNKLATTADTPESFAHRISLTIILEELLMDTGNYKGYHYLSEDDMEQNGPAGWARPGVRRYFDEEDKFGNTSQFANTDDTRRYYI